jgi:hypothetical protein
MSRPRSGSLYAKTQGRSFSDPQASRHTRKPVPCRRSPARHGQFERGSSLHIGERAVPHGHRKTAPVRLTGGVGGLRQVLDQVPGGGKLFPVIVRRRPIPGRPSRLTLYWHLTRSGDDNFGNFCFATKSGSINSTMRNSETSFLRATQGRFRGRSGSICEPSTGLVGRRARCRSGNGLLRPH